MVIECPACDGRHDHQLDWVEARCPKCGGAMVEVVQVPGRVLRGPWLCEHANENPSLCPCDKDCYCRTHTCVNKPLDMVAALRRALERYDAATSKE